MLTINQKLQEIQKIKKKGTQIYYKSKSNHKKKNKRKGVKIQIVENVNAMIINLKQVDLKQNI